MKQFRQSGFVMLLFCTTMLMGQASLVNDTIQIDELIVVGQRYETPGYLQAISYTKMHQQQIKEASPQSLPDLMMNMAGIWMQKTNHGGGSPYIRGLTGYQTLILIDGIRLNNSTFRSGPNQYINTIDPSTLSSIEVLRGGGSVQYGTDGIGGTILLNTKTPEFTENGISSEVNLHTKWMSRDQEKTIGVGLNTSSENTATTAGISYKNLGDIFAGSQLGKLKNTGYDEYSFHTKSRVKITDRHQLTLAAFYLQQQDVPLYHKLVNKEYAIYRFSPQQHTLIYLRDEHHTNAKLFEQQQTTVLYQQSLEVREKQKAEKDLFVTETDKVHTSGIIFENISRPSLSWSFITGTEFYYDLVNSKAESRLTTSGETTRKRGLYPDDSSVKNFSVFTMHNFHQNKLTATGGVRYNYFALEISDSIFGNSSISPQAWVGNLGINYEIVPRTYLSGAIYNAFRAPNINDVSSFGIADFRYEIPNYNLAPEKSLTKEIGIKTQQPFFHASAFFFHNKLNGLIKNVKSSYQGNDSIAGVKVYTRRNLHSAYIKGFEGELRVFPTKKITLSSFLIYTYGQDLSNHEPIRRIPPLNGLVALQYSLNHRLKLALTYHHANHQHRLSSGDIDDSRITSEGTPSWDVVNASASFKTKHLVLNAGIKNIFNESYRVHGSGVDGMGRSFWISMNYNFNFIQKP